MACQLDGPDLAVAIHSGYPDPAVDKPAAKCWIETIAAAKLLRRRLGLVCVVNQGSRRDPHAFCGANQRTAQEAYHWRTCIWGSFLVCGIPDSHHIPRILQQSMLKAPSSANKGPALFTGELDGQERSSGAPVWAARTAPQRVKVAQC
jgi:hypothetical protein